MYLLTLMSHILVHNKRLLYCTHISQSVLQIREFFGFNILYERREGKCDADWNLFWIYLDKSFSILLGFVLFYNIAFWQETFSNQCKSHFLWLLWKQLLRIWKCYHDEDRRALEIFDCTNWRILLSLEWLIVWLT